MYGSVTATTPAYTTTWSAVCTVGIAGYFAVVYGTTYPPT
jgi:hypothetical protein